MARILAIEPDRDRAAALQRRLRESLDATIVIATSTEAAIAAMAEDPPDLILTSTLLPPDEDVRLGAYLRQEPSLRHLAVLTVPPVLVRDEDKESRTGLFSRMIQRRPKTWQTYDFDAVAGRIREALAEAQSSAAESQPSKDLVLAPAAALQLSDDELRAYCGLGPKQARARRWTPHDLPWLAGVRFAWGQELRLINISRSGLLVESGFRLTPGNLTQFQLSGRHRDVFVTARIVRSRVADVQPLGVHYVSAAQFEQTFDELAEDRDSPEAAADPETHLRHLVERLRQEAAGGANAEDLRGKFEEGVHRLVTAREIRIRETPVVENDGRDSVYFVIPTSSGSRAILQVTFEPNYRPDAAEFAALRAASIAAAEILPDGMSSAASA